MQNVQSIHSHEHCVIATKPNIILLCEYIMWYFVFKTMILFKGSTWRTIWIAVEIRQTAKQNLLMGQCRQCFRKWVICQQWLLVKIGSNNRLLHYMNKSHIAFWTIIVFMVITFSPVIANEDWPMQWLPRSKVVTKVYHQDCSTIK